MDLAQIFAEALPITSERFQLAFVTEVVDPDTGEISGGTHEDDRGYWRATMRTITWEPTESGDLQIRDIKEQDVVWLYPEHRSDPRVPAYIAGWAMAVKDLLDRHAELAAAGLPGADRLDAAMPFDFFSPSVLGLRRPQTADDFADALLASKKRLGKLLP